MLEARVREATQVARSGGQELACKETSTTVDLSRAHDLVLLMELEEAPVRASAAWQWDAVATASAGGEVLIRDAADVYVGKSPVAKLEDKNVVCGEGGMEGERGRQAGLEQRDK